MTVCNRRIAPAALMLLGLLVFSVSGCGGSESAGSGGDFTPRPAPEGTKITSESGIQTDTKNAGTPKTEASAPAEEKLGKVPIIIDTSMGKIEAELNGEKAPLSVKNFVAYVKKKHYDGTIFHRVIPGFMIQGGGFTPDMSEKDTDAPIKNESGNGLENDRGALAMARTRDLDSATSQFYINVVDNPDLDSGQYAVFGKVTKGLDVVDKIVAVPTTNKDGHGDVPVEPVVIKSIKIKEGAAK